MRRRIVAAIAALAITAASPPARARTDAEVQAQALFLEGMKLMGAKRVAEACPKLKQSQELDPGMGTQFRLAECYEKLGRLASAHEQFTAVADAARAARKPDRETVARQRAAALEARLAKLTITIPPAVAALGGLEVTRDGAPVEKRLWGTPIPVDPGEHTVTVKAPGKKPWDGKATAEGSAQLSVSVPPLEDLAPPLEKPPPARSTAPAIALGVVGGVGIALGATLVGLRAVRASDAHALHDKISAAKGDCVGGGKGTLVADCSALARATSSGDTFGTVSVVGFVVGGAAIAGMVTYLLLPAPKPARPADAVVRWSPAVGAGQGGLALWGTF